MICFICGKEKHRYFVADVVGEKARICLDCGNQLDKNVAMKCMECGSYGFIPKNRVNFKRLSFFFPNEFQGLASVENTWIIIPNNACPSCCFQYHKDKEVMGKTC